MIVSLAFTDKNEMFLETLLFAWLAEVSHRYLHLAMLSLFPQRWALQMDSILYYKEL